ncbi:MAG: SDR family oxidoreductase [Hyphomicrobiales bacterium]|nr:SDR family oxidoreductase [Hyphomicrobiales bacterium]MCP5370290.1 SDR family oxidoreductase [Hyphomicrobiales bacterium]
MDLGLKDKVALVTGGGQGVGRAICRTLAAEGARVVVNDLAPDRAEAVAAEIRAAGGTALAAAADVIDLDAVRAMVAQAEQELGPVDILVNNAGVVPERRTGEIGLPVFAESDPAHWRKFVDLNVYGMLNCCHAVVAGMTARRRGKIITIVSDAGRVGEPRMAVYAAAKAAALGFTKTLAKELGRHRINVNTVALSAVAHEAPMADFLREDATAENNETLAKVLRQYPIGQGLGRLTRPQDAADAVAFMASDRAAYVTGQCLPVNGGFAMV